jgi:hypothetical protein
MKLRVYLRRLVWFLAGIVALYLLIVLVENWTGARALAAAKLKLEQAGETLDLDSLRAKSVPDEVNFCAIDPLVGITLDDEEHGKTKNAEFKKLDWGALWQNNQSKKPAPSLTNGSMLGQPFDFQGALAHLREVTYLDSPADASPERVLADIDRLHPSLKELSDAAPVRPEAVFIPTPDETSWPHMNPVIAITKSLALRSQVAVEASDSESAVRSIQASLRLTRAMSDEPTLIGQLVAMTTSINEQNSIWSLIHRRTATETQLARLQSDLERQDFMNSMTQAVSGERAFMIHSIAWMQRQHRVPTQADLFVKQEPSRLENVLDWLVPAGWFDHNAATVLRMHSEYFLEPLKTGDVRIMETSFDEFERMIADHTTFSSPHHVMAHINLPAFRFVIEQAVYSEAVRRQAVTAIAIERFHLANGRLPGTLAELVPAFIEAIPLDPMDKNSMRYQAEADNFTLWSIAWDQQDNHGKLPTRKEASGIHRSESYIGDWVWKN